MVKLISLNIWGGHVEKPLLHFFNSHQNIDIFCLQEVYKSASHKICDDDQFVSLDVFGALQKLLPNHHGIFKPVVQGIYGIGVLISEKFTILDEGEAIIHENADYKGSGPTHSRILQWAKCQADGKTHTIVNVHGLWNGQGKTDSPARINQSLKIKEFMDNVKGSKLLCGDFNLRPDTESIKIIESGLNNHIKINNIKCTRTSFYPKTERFADYIFTSPNIMVQDFKVLPDEVSDHAPLLIEFN